MEELRILLKPIYFLAIGLAVVYGIKKIVKESIKECKNGNYKVSFWEDEEENKEENS